MAENSKIEWTDHTFNPWRGCTKVSPGCTNCYAEALSKRTGHGEYKRGVPRERTGAANWRKPVIWNSKSQMVRDNYPDERRTRVFCASLADWLDDEVPIEWLADLLKLIHDTPNLDYLMLSKRIDQFFQRCWLALFHAETHGSEATFVEWLRRWLDGESAPSNVWLGTTVEDQKRADERIPELLKIPAKIRFLSVEPQLEIISLYGAFKACWHMPIKYRDWRTAPVAEVRWERQALVAAGWRQGIHWVICGGESGPKRRPFNCDWARSLRDQCKAASVPFFMKQVDKVQPIPADLLIREFPNETAR